MDYSSTLANMLFNPNHINYTDIAYNTDLPTYILRDNTLFFMTSAWCRDFRAWLKSYGIDLGDDRRVYTPCAKLVEGELIGYNTQFANMGNKFLDMGETTRQCYYDNLYFVEIGNHPYPKQGRFHHSWVVENYHRECHRLFNPPSDPNDFFFTMRTLVPK